MSAASIAAEVDAAYAEVALEVGNGAFTVTLTQTTGAPVNPWGADTSVETATDLNALIADYPQNMIDGTLIQMGDRKVMLSAIGPEPTTADTLTIKGVLHAIVSVMPLAPSGEALFYEVQARV